MLFHDYYKCYTVFLKTKCCELQAFPFVFYQGLVNFLDPEPCCNDLVMHVWEEGEGPLLEEFRGHGGNPGKDGLSTLRKCCCMVCLSTR
jgi:hypothetical protein